MTRPVAHPWLQAKDYLILSRSAAAERRRYLEDWEHRMQIARLAGVTSVDRYCDETERP